MAIQEMHLLIKHRSGRSNAGADALSRDSCDTADVSAVVADPPEADIAAVVNFLNSLMPLSRS